MTEMVEELLRCMPPLELWSVSHGLTWQIMVNTVSWAELSNATHGPALLRTLGGVFCRRELMPWYTDCYHGVGHGIIHSYLIDRENARHTGISYNLTRQFFEVPMDGQDFDAAVRLCCVFTYEEAVGCADGVAHSYFVFWPASYFPSDVVSWCSARVWPAFCFRTLFHHARLSYFGVPPIGGGVDARVDYMNLLLLRPNELYDQTARLMASCAAATADVAPSCMWGLMSSGLKGFVTREWSGLKPKMSAAAIKAFVAVCSAPHVQNRSNAALLDACLLP
eukprot:6359524-Prymnesium_polylepis.1